jgi:predicted transcriptional regulator
MFRHYRVIIRELVINTLPSYTSISDAAVGNTVYNYDVSHRFYAQSLNQYVDSSNNIQTAYTATTHTEFIRIVATK